MSRQVSQPLHVLVLLRSLERNGITTYNTTLAKALRAAGHRVTVWPGDPVVAGMTLPGWCLQPGMASLLTQRVRGLAPDLLYISHYTQGLLAARLSERLGIPWFACMHNGHNDARMAEWRELFATASGVVTLCQTMHQVYAPLVETVQPRLGQHVGVLPIDLSAVQLRPQRSAEAPLRLAYCARLSGQKGPRCEAWLHAVALLSAEQPVQARVIGGGSDLARLRQVAQKLGLAVEFTGLVPDTAPWLQDVDVLAGAGYALVEGLVRGCAGVGIGFGGCWGAVTPERLTESVAVNFGDHCPHPLPQSPEAIRDALKVAIAACQSGAAQAVSQRCRQVFDAEKQAAELVAYWRPILEARGGGLAEAVG